MNDGLINIQCKPTPTLFVRAVVAPPSNVPLSASDADVPFAGSDAAGDLTGSD